MPRCSGTIPGIPGYIMTGERPTNALNWSFQPNTNASLDASFWASPTVVNGVVYIGGNDQIMYAINAFTGASIWNSTISNGDIDSSAAVSNGRVIFGSYDSNVYSLDLNGVKVWNRSTSSGIRTSPAVENGYIYIANDAGRVYRLIESSGVIDWNVPTNLTPGGGMHSSPAVANGIVYVGNMDGKLYALYANNGTQFWNRHHHGRTRGILKSRSGKRCRLCREQRSRFVCHRSNERYIYSGESKLVAGLHQVLRWRMDLSISGASTAIYMP